MACLQYFKHVHLDKLCKTINYQQISTNYFLYVAWVGPTFSVQKKTGNKYDHVRHHRIENSGIHSGLKLQGLNLSHQIFLERCWIWGVWGRISQCLAALLNKATTHYSVQRGQLPAVNERYERWPCATIFEDDVRLAPNFTLRVSETVGSLPPFDARKKDPVVSAPAHNKTDGRVQQCSALPAINTRFFPSCLTLSAWNKSIYSILQHTNLTKHETAWNR